MTAVVMNIRSPQMTGLECPIPGIGVCQATFRSSGTLHSLGVGEPVETPLAPVPRKEGQ